jgi:protein AFG1
MNKAPVLQAYKQLLNTQKLAPNASQTALAERLGKLQTQLIAEDAEKELKGVYIYGSVGTGKSRIADLFSETMPRQVSHRRVHFHEFLMDIHSRLHKERSQSGYKGDPLFDIGAELVQKESRVLCFDEFQVSDIADAMILKRLFAGIWQAGGVMVATSNRHPQNLYERGLNRPLFVPFIQELQKRCDVWHMEGQLDYRLRTSGKQDERDTVLFVDNAAFEASLKDAVKGEPLVPTVLKVMMGRELAVKACIVPAGPASGYPKHHCIVQASFQELCEQNLGSSDYYALCHKASVLYLSGLRQFKEDELDFIRRLITLIDLAYETKTRVVCQSSVPLFDMFTNIVPQDEAIKAAEMSVKKGGGSSSSMMSTFIGEMEWSATGLPASLATGGAGESDVKFAIGRCVSRLFEMGAKSYGLK